MKPGRLQKKKIHLVVMRGVGISPHGVCRLCGKEWLNRSESWHWNRNHYMKDVKRHPDRMCIPGVADVLAVMEV